MKLVFGILSSRSPPFSCRIYIIYILEGLAEFGHRLLSASYIHIYPVYALPYPFLLLLPYLSCLDLRSCRKEVLPLLLLLLLSPSLLSLSLPFSSYPDLTRVPAVLCSLPLKIDLFSGPENSEVRFRDDIHSMFSRCFEKNKKQQNRYMQKNLPNSAQDDKAK